MRFNTPAEDGVLSKYYTLDLLYIRKYIICLDFEVSTLGSLGDLSWEGFFPPFVAIQWR